MEFYTIYNEKKEIAPDRFIEGPISLKLDNYKKVFIGFDSEDVAEIFKEKIKIDGKIVHSSELRNEPYKDFMDKNFRYVLIFNKEVLANYVLNRDGLDLDNYIYPFNNNS